MALADWQKRVVEERDALAIKMYSLDEFMNSAQGKALPHEDFEILASQYHAMSAYAHILCLRITRFYT